MVQLPAYPTPAWQPKACEAVPCQELPVQHSTRAFALVPRVPDPLLG